MADQKKRWFYTINPPFFRLEKSGWPEKIRVCRTTEKWLQIKLMIVYFIQDVVALFHVWFKLTNNSKRLMNTLSSTLSNFENQIMLKHVFYLNFDRGHSLLYLRRNKVHKNNNHTGSFIRESIIFHFANFWLNCCLWNWRHWHTLKYLINKYSFIRLQCWAPIALTRAKSSTLQPNKRVLVY